MSKLFTKYFGFLLVMVFKLLTISTKTPKLIVPPGPWPHRQNNPWHFDGARPPPPHIHTITNSIHNGQLFPSISCSENAQSLALKNCNFIFSVFNYLRKPGYNDMPHK